MVASAIIPAAPRNNGVFAPPCLVLAARVATDLYRLVLTTGDLLMHRTSLTNRSLRVARGCALGVAIVLSSVGGAAADSTFPFGHELLLDARPMKGSKRVPILDIRANGAAEIDLWCNSVQGQIVVSHDTITITTGEKTERQCEPERMRRDDDMLSALSQVTGWRLQGDTLILSGSRTMRFRMETN
jgi:heat shock protein HslJ